MRKRSRALVWRLNNLAETHDSRDHVYTELSRNGRVTANRPLAHSGGFLHIEVSATREMIQSSRNHAAKDNSWDNRGFIFLCAYHIREFL